MTSLNDCWQTPTHILTAVREVMPVIGLDPATGPDNPVGALTYCTGLSNDCGLAMDWGGHSDVWLNHPYSQTSAWLCKVRQALLTDPNLRILNLAPMAVLSNRGTRGLLSSCYVVPLGRLKFVPPQALRAEREAQGKKADPGSPRSDVGIFMHRYDRRYASILAKALGTLCLEVTSIDELASY